jgi:Sigma-70, region 4
LERLPAAYRAVLVLCYLEGHTHDEAAQCLGVEVGVVKGWPERGRKMLAERLTSRGLTLSVGLLAIAVSPSTVLATVKAASSFAASQSVSGVVAPSVLRLTNEVLQGATMSNANVPKREAVASPLYEE